MPITRIAFSIMLAFVLQSVSMTSYGLSNVLLDHPAPYLALHGNDPVAWQVWDEQAVQRARDENKVLYLSVGYFSCHWCHVMQKESYQNERIARFLNQHFVPVKVDRELQPALDNRLMDFAQRVLGHGGWPLNVFITPDGYPIYAVLYAPPSQFLGMLQKLQSAWVQDPDRIAQLVSSENAHAFPAPSSNLDKNSFLPLLANAATGVMQRADTKYGGFGNSQKFPSTPQLDYLLKVYEQSNSAQLKSFLELTLNEMAMQGLNDHLAGGFFRYTTDVQWQIPHFEKMLYDNASLAKLYVEAGRLLGLEQIEQVGHDTFKFMLDYMWHPDGAFISSFSAVDDKNIEGGSYLWTVQQIAEVLNPAEVGLVNALWNLDREPELPAGNHLRFSMDLQQYAILSQMDDEQVKTLYDSARSKLLAARMQRSLPADDKLLTGWNAMALSAFTYAHQTFPNKGYGKTAEQLRNFILDRMWDGESLSRSLSKGNLIGAASLEDYAYSARAVFDWAKLNNNEEDMKVALQIARQGWSRFYRNNGWYQGDGTLLAPVAGEEMPTDSANPAPSAVLIGVSLELAQEFDDQGLKNLALSASNRGQSYLQGAPFWFVSQLQALALALK